LASELGLHDEFHRGWAQWAAQSQFPHIAGPACLLPWCKEKNNLAMIGSTSWALYALFSELPHLSAERCTAQFAERNQKLSLHSKDKTLY
jgi:hypothetical protein